MKTAALGAVLVLALLVALVLKTFTKSVGVSSDLTGKTYRVLDRPDAQQAADALARLELAVEDFLVKAEEIVPGDKRLANIRERWTHTFKEINGKANVAYSISKSDISVCIRRKDGSLHSTEDGMFVVLHELAHISNDNWGHGDEYWETFKWLLELAERTGTLRFKNFDEAPETYCGLRIASNPVSCVHKGTCKSALGPIRPLK